MNYARAVFSLFAECHTEDLFIVPYLLKCFVYAHCCDNKATWYVSIDTVQLDHLRRDQQKKALI